MTDGTVLPLPLHCPAAPAVINGGKYVDLAIEVSVVALLNEDKWDEVRRWDSKPVRR